MDEDYEVAIPPWWTKRQLANGSWVLASTKAPEYLSVRVLVPESGHVDAPSLAVRALASNLVRALKLACAADVCVDTDGTTFSASGTSPRYAYRVLANDHKVVWALHHLFAADDGLDVHRETILASLKLR